MKIYLTVIIVFLFNVFEVDCGHYSKSVSEWATPHYPIQKYEYYTGQKCCKDKIIHVPVVKKVHIPVVKHVPYPVIKKKVVIKKIKIPVPVIKKKIVVKKVHIPIPVHHHHVVIKKKEKKKKKKKCKKEKKKKCKKEKKKKCKKEKKKKCKKEKEEEYESYGYDAHVPPSDWPHHIPWM